MCIVLVSNRIVDPIGRTPLIYACELGNFRWIEDLLEAKADVRAVDADGWNVIHCASFRGNYELLELLLPLTDAAGVDINALTADGRTALDLAKDGRFMPDPAVADKLLAHGAQVTMVTVRNVPDHHGLSSKHRTEMERLEKLRSGALGSVMPLATLQAAVSIIGLLWTSLTVYEVPWQMAHISIPLLVRCTLRTSPPPEDLLFVLCTLEDMTGSLDCLCWMQLPRRSASCCSTPS
jgi:hypothetical protein